MSEAPADYDTAWKKAITEFFEPFLDFFFPQVHRLIDFNSEVVSLEKELLQIMPAATSGKKFADKLYRVKLKNQKTIWVLIHIEVQSQNDSDFNKRMFQYHYRAFDLYEEKVISLALLGDDRKNWRPTSYGYSIGGCQITLKFPIAKLSDYKLDDLELHENPLAILVIAHLKTMTTMTDFDKREEAKWTLVKSLYERGYNQDRIIQLFQIIDWMMSLPTELQNKFEQQLEQYEEERQVEVMSCIEQRALAKGEQIGIEIGKQEGIEIGTQQATVQTLKSSIIKILVTKFSTLSPELTNKINSLTNIPQLDALLTEAVLAPSVDLFEQTLDGSIGSATQS